MAKKTIHIILLFLFLFGVMHEGYANKKDRHKKDSIAAAEKQKAADDLKKAEGNTSFFGNILHAASPKEYKHKVNEHNLKRRQKQKQSFYNDHHDIPQHNSRTEHHKKFDSIGFRTERQWDTIHNIVHSEPTFKNHQLTKEVYGFHPFWMGRAYKSYNFSLLSRIGYFSYAVNPHNGSYNSIHSWRTTDLISLAHKYNCKVDLCVTNFGPSNNKILLRNNKAQNNLITNIISLLKEENGDGVTIDFEGLPKIHGKAFTNFIINLSTKLKAANPNYQISICLPAIDFQQAFETEILQQYVDRFIIMGYDFYGKKSLVAGPNSLLLSGDEWYKFNLHTSLNYYLNDKNMPPEMCVLALAYYGKEWQTAKGTIPSRSEKFNNTRTYRYIQDHYGNKYNISYDTVSSSAYYTFNDSGTWVQCWFDDVHSLGIKYDYVLSTGIAGVGIWALGFDNGYSDFWDLLAHKFSSSIEKPTLSLLPLKTTLPSLDIPVEQPDLQIKTVQPAHKEPVPQFSVKDSLKNIRIFVMVLTLTIFVLILFGSIGFVYAITDCNVRDLVFKQELAIYLFVLTLLVMIIIVLRVFDIILDKEITFLFGIILGLLISYILLKKARKRKEQIDMP